MALARALSVMEKELFSMNLIEAMAIAMKEVGWSDELIAKQTAYALSKFPHPDLKKQIELDKEKERKVIDLLKQGYVRQLIIKQLPGGRKALRNKRKAAERRLRRKASNN
jgi:hypothetical protein